MLKLSDHPWDRIREHFPEENIPVGRAGRKPIPTRGILEAVLWILNTGAQWHMLPQCYPNYKTVHRRFQPWCRSEVMTDLANTLRDEGALDESECFIAATFASAKGGGAEIGPTKRGKGVKIMAIEAKPENPIGDRAYDSDKLDEELREDGIKMSAPHGSNRVRPRTQDGRRLRRYERHRLVERFFAWLRWQRRLSWFDGNITPKIFSASCSSQLSLYC